MDLGHSKQKRARGQLSCTPCRVGKLKCNRLRDPACDQCIKRGREAACHYVPPPSKNRTPSNVKGRIRQLEDMVRGLIAQQNDLADHPTPPSSDGDDNRVSSTSTNVDANVEASLGKLAIRGGEVAYTGESHWQTILSSLSEIQDDLDNEGAAQDDEETNETGASANGSPGPATSLRPETILGTTKALTKEELIKMVPEKRTADRLLSLWFNSPDPFKIIIHAPTFQDEYKQFWVDQNVPPMWLGLLFAILCLAESFGVRTHQPGSPAAITCLERVRRYQSLTASAAVLGEYTKPKEYTLECLLLHGISLRGDNAAMDAWVLMGIIVRLALRMGYHRDPGHYPKLTPFQGEMRRRVWSMTSMIEVLMSFQLGLPSMVKTVASDTKPPENLLDRDFSRTSGLLPAGRGDHELTPSLYTRTKLRIMNIFAQAVELSHATVPPSYDTVQGLAADLEEAKNEIPLALRMPDISELVTDPAEQLMCRFNIDLLYSKCRIVLFRRYMLVPLSQLSEQEYHRGIGEGREACIKSARRVLDHHHTIYNAIQPGGQLENMKWYMGSIAVLDFLLAAMVICLELSQQLHKDKMLRISNSMQCPTRQAMLNALQRSYNIWTESTRQVASTMHNDQPSGDMYEETEKARRAMALMLARIKAQDTSTAADADKEPASQTSVFEEDGHSYYTNMGLTPQSARDSSKIEGIRGVLTTHNWDGVPDDFQFGTAPQAVAYTASTDRLAYDLTAGNVDLLPDQMDFDFGDSMNLDWQVWDTEVLNMNDTGKSWSTERTTSDVQTPALSNTSGMHFTLEDMQNVDLGPDFYTPFIKDQDSSPWVRNAH